MGPNSARWWRRCFSLEVLLSTFGDAALGDRLEKIAYNALPGTFDDAMWAHQYDQQSNQVQCSLNSKPWSTNGPESNLYGLEPNFGCCTANFHQGWPKLTTHLWMRECGDGGEGDGLVAAVYAPCSVRTKVRGIEVQVEEETEYPFRETVTLRLAPAAPVEFPLTLRIPGWAVGATVRREWRGFHGGGDARHVRGGDAPLEGGRCGGDEVPHAAAYVTVGSRISRGGAWPAGVLAGPRTELGGVAQARADG